MHTHNIANYTAVQTSLLNLKPWSEGRIKILQFLSLLRRDKRGAGEGSRRVQTLGPAEPPRPPQPPEEGWGARQVQRGRAGRHGAGQRRGDAGAHPPAPAVPHGRGAHQRSPAPLSRRRPLSPPRAGNGRRPNGHRCPTAAGRRARSLPSAPPAARKRCPGPAAACRRAPRAASRPGRAPPARGRAAKSERAFLPPAGKKRRPASGTVGGRRGSPAALTSVPGRVRGSPGREGAARLQFERRQRLGQPA